MFSMSQTDINYRDYTQSREEHLQLPSHNWVKCHSWHCFHGNELNWTKEHRDYRNRIENEQENIHQRNRKLQGEFLSIIYSGLASLYFKK